MNIRPASVAPRFGILRVPAGQINDPARAQAAQIEMKTKIDNQLSMLGGNQHAVVVQYDDLPARYGDAVENLTVETRDFNTVANTLRIIPGFQLESRSQTGFNENEYTYTDQTGYKLLVTLQDPTAANQVRPA